MFQWLEGPGKAFKEPLHSNSDLKNPGASGNTGIGYTNYMGAYDKTMVMNRTSSINELDRKPRDQLTPWQKNALELKEQGSIPPEQSRNDLRPFVHNKHFTSEPVLSEELREEVYRRVTQEGKSVRVVSVELGVDMRRVGAVVRLKAIEKSWKREVIKFPYGPNYLLTLSLK
jgi:Eukaryotic mitochondrial regulator protein